MLAAEAEKKALDSPLATARIRSRESADSASIALASSLVAGMIPLNFRRGSLRTVKSNSPAGIAAPSAMKPMVVPPVCSRAGSSNGSLRNAATASILPSNERR
ncbi:hypothetical protein D9M70_627090 [compost metagenome]